MSINKNELTKEQIAKAMSCETAEELMALAKSEGIELTKDEAKAYMAELQDFDLDDENIKKIAGGTNLTLKCPMKGYWSVRPIHTVYLRENTCAWIERAKMKLSNYNFLKNYDGVNVFFNAKTCALAIEKLSPFSFLCL